MSVGTIFLAGMFLCCTLSASGQERRGNERERTPPKQEPLRGRDRGRVEPRRTVESARPADRGRIASGRSGDNTPSSLGVRLPSGKQVDTSTRPRAGEGKDAYNKVFSHVQQGLASGSVGSFSQHMSSQVYVNLRGGESGYYSASQAYYLLENYFKTRKLVNFNFTTIGESDSNPYATGSAGFNFKGSREYAQVYVSLSFVGDQWVVTQINIY